MKKWTGGMVIIVLALLLVVSYSLIIWKSEPNPKKQSAYDFFNPHPPKEDANNLPEVKVENLQPVAKFRYLDGLNELYSFSKKLSKRESGALLVWGRMRFVFPRSDALPEMAQGIKEAASIWKDLLLLIEKDYALKLENAVISKSCPYFVSAPNTKFSLRNESFVEIPCGLVEESSVTVIGIPNSRQDSFEIELIGSHVKEEPEPPIVLQYKVYLPGENLTKEPVIVQNTWTGESGWGKEEKCPDHGAPALLKVDGLVKCNRQVVQRNAEVNQSASRLADRKVTNISEGNFHASTTFQFIEGSLFTATLWAGDEGFHMTVNGRHETSFTYREKLEPWLINRVKVKGGLDIVSIIAKGLPVSEDSDLVADVENLKAPPILANKRIVLLIGVFSAANNFERRMALRRTWMQYDAVRSGVVAVRFFIGLHKNIAVNLKIWKEAQAYGDIQLLPFVDYYSLLTYKTIAICIMGTKILPAKYIMKTDDDAFLRIDEVISSLKGKTPNGLLYGHVSFESAPHRDKDNKWFISEQEWPHSSYPPWAHGPGYVISRDIAKFIVQAHHDGRLMLFKLEDVAVGIWIDQYRKKGEKIEYIDDDRFFNAGCDTNYVLAHYQNPRMMLCLWEKLVKDHKPECCD